VRETSLSYDLDGGTTDAYDFVFITVCPFDTWHLCYDDGVNPCDESVITTQFGITITQGAIDPPKFDISTNDATLRGNTYTFQ
jgi:hypothetical protein